VAGKRRTSVVFGLLYFAILQNLLVSIYRPKR
jgi:hypothetical protein